MPVQNETLYNVKRLNLVFAVSSVAFLVITAWMMIEDHNATWKYHQADFQRNVATLTELELQRYESPDFQRQLDAAHQRLAAAETQLAANPQLRDIQRELAAEEARLQGVLLKYNDAKSVLDVRKQEYERADALAGRSSRAFASARTEFEALAATFQSLAREKEKVEDRLAELKSARKELSKSRDEAKKSLAALQRKIDTAQKRLDTNEPSGLNWIANNLLDFAVGQIRVKQVVLPEVRKPLNFLDSYQVDRCQSCHVAIDRAEFGDEEMCVNLLLAVAAANSERQAAGKTPVSLPIPLPDAPPAAGSGAAPPSDDDLKKLADLETQRERVIRDHWRRLVLADDRDGQQKLLTAALAAMNEIRGQRGESALSLEHPLRAHPRLDLYVSPDSPHPINKMGCTVCHGGNGDETSFTTAIHTAETHEQEEEWIDKYQGRIDYTLAHHWWTRPMYAKKYVEASCTKCHEQAADVAQFENEPLATRITHGRQLYADLGCINCHKVANIDDSRRVGPDLRHISSKLTPEFTQPWVWYPRDFRPSTHMPHFFRQENNAAHSSLPDDPDADPALRTETEVAAITQWLFSFSTPYAAEQIPEGLAAAGDAENGRVLFEKTGCLACHAALKHRSTPNDPTLGEKWITADLAHREKLAPEKALMRARAMTYAEQVRYAMEKLPPENRERAEKLKEHTRWEMEKARKDGDAEKVNRLSAELANFYVPAAFTRFAPELSGIGSKTTLPWLYDWLRNPRHYSEYTKMPSLRLSEKEAVDIASYLLTLKNDEFQQHTFELNDQRQAMLDHLILELLGGQNSLATSQRILNDEDGRLTEMLARLLKTAIPDPSQARAKVEALDLPTRKLVFLGNKMINHYGCYACHVIPGFETAQRPGTEMTAWAEKSINQLDFAFFTHMFEEKMGERLHHLYPEEPEFAHLVQDGGQRDIHVGHKHSSFAWHKLRNPRIWDRDKFKSPYEKLKMPNFYLTDAEADALVTYLLSRQKPYVTPSIVAGPDTLMPDVGAGRNLVAELNCVGCHNIEHNAATMHQYITLAAGGAAGGAAEEEEEEETEETEESGGKPAAAPAAAGASLADQAAAILAAHGAFDEVNGPPWLRGEGAKIQHAWLADFLHNVRTLRPWLAVRMPSFHLTNDQARTIAAYFAAVAQRESRQLQKQLAGVDKYLATSPSDKPASDWHRDPQFAKTTRYLAKYALDNRLKNPLDFHGDAASADIAKSYDDARRQAAFFADLYNVHYPFVAAPRALVGDERFASGRELVIDRLDCLACHALGDPNVPGANKSPTAPNLSLTHRRLRWEWVDKWMQEPAWIQPGTKMPQWFPGGRSAFVDFGETRAAYEQKFGSQGPQQIDVLLDFLYEAGERAYTGVKGQKTAPAAESSAAASRQKQ
ncbi:MAG: hypothetical protein CHACPFDD_04025 [Phycisphaerae bacterium]|nr:hypothetical protein [Phycisphaerae bacterium]